MDDEKNGLQMPEDLRLSRSEAARYVGVAGESAVRAAEAKGLAGIADEKGQVWHRPADLEAWTWRGKPPTATQKSRVLREAARSRQQEARARERAEDQEYEREAAEADAQLARMRAEWNVEDAFKVKVKHKADDMRAAFKAMYIDETMAARALGFESYDASQKVRTLVEQGLLRQFESPREPTYMLSFDGPREVAGGPLCWGGPFYLREEVLALRRETAQVVRESFARAPEPVRQVVNVAPEKDLVEEFLRLLMDLSSR